LRLLSRKAAMPSPKNRVCPAPSAVHTEAIQKVKVVPLPKENYVSNVKHVVYILCSSTRTYAGE